MLHSGHDDRAPLRFAADRAAGSRCSQVRRSSARFNPRVAQEARDTIKPTLHGKHWVAITGKPLAATAGALTFANGGNAVDAACAMLAAAATMWDTLSWGGETVALVYDPRAGKVRTINALGVAPTGATPEFFRERGLHGPPDYGPLAADDAGHGRAGSSRCSPSSAR